VRVTKDDDLLGTVKLIAGALFQAIAGRGAASVGMIEVTGIIQPATADYISRAIAVSGERRDVCLIIQLNTPGGLVTSTEQIVSSFYNSEVPVVVYVAPPPASAASAGALITMAADVAVMAPHTRIGAAHPVNIGPGGGAEKVDDVMKKKQENDLASFAESIAVKRNRNAEWARAAVLESESVTAERAVELKVIDLIADDLPDLLGKIDGLKVRNTALKTADATVIKIPMTLRERFLNAILRPEVMFVLVLIVIYGIIGELSNPGAILPGVAGAIALILFLYMSSALPVRAAGLALLALALVLFIIDIFTPTHGVLTGGGIISFFLGAVMLFDRSEPAFRLSLWIIIPATVLTALFFLFFVGAGLRAQRLPIRAGHETMLGQVVPALERFEAQAGRVFIEGELWKAVSDVVVAQDQPVEVVGIEGLVLKVKPKTA